MKTVITTIGVLTCMVCGCADNIVELGNSPFEPGIYSGLNTCISTVFLDGVVMEEGMNTKDTTVTIGASGLPTYQGHEVSPGLNFSTDYGFGVVSGVVTTLTVANNGVLVDSDVAVTIDGGDAGSFEWVGVFSDDYLPGQQGTISNPHDLGVGGLRADGRTLWLTVDCTLELGRAG